MKYVTTEIDIKNKRIGQTFSYNFENLAFNLQYPHRTDWVKFYTMQSFMY